MIEVTFRVDADIDDVSATDIRDTLEHAGFRLAVHPLGHTVHVKNLDCKDDDPAEYYETVCTDAYAIPGR